MAWKMPEFHATIERFGGDRWHIGCNICYSTKVLQWATECKSRSRAVAAFKLHNNAKHAVAKPKINERIHCGEASR